MDRPTIATAFHNSGYRTGVIGKWHLGMRMPVRRSGDVDLESWEGDPGIDFAAQITDSPLHHGFDYFFGVSASLDMAPYVYIQNDRFTMPPALEQVAVDFPHFVRRGPRSSDFVIEEVLDRLTDEAVSFIKQSTTASQPFFLYLPLTGPHKPTQPHERFRGKTKLNEYGDFVHQVDWTVGQVLKAISEVGARDDTLVVFSSDNGSYMYSYDDTEEADHVTDASRDGYFPRNHRANGRLRGTKADIWEAGHRTPLFVRWPGRIPTQTRSNTTVCLVDLFATCAEAAGVEVPDGAAEDSYSFLPALEGRDFEREVPVVHHSANGTFAIRQGRWKLILGNGSGGRQSPVGQPFGKPYQLFDLSQDISESSDLADTQPEIVEQLTKQLDVLRTE
jgi:arylsulfatase A-like enzyme